MGRFDLHRSAPKTLIPDWVSNENERTVFNAVLARIGEIEALIESSGSPLTASECKIAKSVICKELGLSASYIAKNPKLNDFVNGSQRKLKRMSESLREVKSQRSANARKPEAMNKSELVEEVKELRSKLDARSTELYVEQLKSLLDSGLAESQIIVRNRIKKLEDELLEVQIANQKLKSAAIIIQRELIATLKKSGNVSSITLSLVENAADMESLVDILQVVKKRSGN